MLGFFLIQVWLVAGKGELLFAMILLEVVHVVWWFLVLVVVLGVGFSRSSLIMLRYLVPALTMNTGHR